MVLYGIYSTVSFLSGTATYLIHSGWNLYLDRCDIYLGRCGVQYAHSTKSVVGSDQREEKMSRTAIRDVFWNGVYSQQLANEDNQNLANGDKDSIVRFKINFVFKNYFNLK